MSMKNYSRVRLLNDRYRDEGVTAGAIGYVIEVYGDDAYEVEFSAEDGTTIAQFVVHGDEAVEEPERGGK
jgi:hypothetical protein